MGKIEGVRIQNFGPLRDIVMGKTLSNQKNAALNNVTERVLWQMLLDFWQTALNLAWRLPVMLKIELV